jgi:hypothetical protein
MGINFAAPRDGIEMTCLASIILFIYIVLYTYFQQLLDTNKISGCFIKKCGKWVMAMRPTLPAKLLTDMQVQIPPYAY